MEDYFKKKDDEYTKISGNGVYEFFCEQKPFLHFISYTNHYVLAWEGISSIEEIEKFFADIFNKCLKKKFKEGLDVKCSLFDEEGYEEYEKRDVRRVPYSWFSKKNLKFVMIETEPFSVRAEIDDKENFEKKSQVQIESKLPFGNILPYFTKFFLNTNRSLSRSDKEENFKLISNELVPKLKNLSDAVKKAG